MLLSFFDSTLMGWVPFIIRDSKASNYVLPFFLKNPDAPNDTLVDATGYHTFWAASRPYKAWLMQRCAQQKLTFSHTLGC